MKRKRLLLAALLIAVILIASCTCPKPKSTELPQWSNNILFTYAGEVSSSGEAAEVITKFTLDERGSLVGEYKVKESDRVIDGELKDCRTAEMREVECTWQDPFGSGTLRLEFSPDFERFDGIWNIEGEQEGFEWNGVKQES